MFLMSHTIYFKEKICSGKTPNRGLSEHEDEVRHTIYFKEDGRVQSVIQIMLLRLQTFTDFLTHHQIQVLESK